jgi:hypothetical protein
MEAIDDMYQPGYRPISLSWQSMFQQLKEYHDRGKKNKRPIPPEMISWMSMNQRQYRVYGIGLKEPVGIIKHRVKKLNELGFEWNPSLMDLGEEDESSDEREEEAVKQTKTRASNRSSARRRYSNMSEQEEVEPRKRAASSRRRSSYASEEKDVDATFVKKRAPPSKTRHDDTTKSGSVKGITRQAPNKKWQVRTNDKITNERIYLGSYDNHSDAVEALRAWQERGYNPIQHQKPSPPPKKKQNKAKKSQTKKWKVNLNHSGKQIYIGSYDTHEEAADALRKAKKDLSLPQRHGRNEEVTPPPKCKRWEVRIKVPGVKGRKYIGSYDTEAEALQALHEAQRKYNPGVPVDAGDVSERHEPLDSAALSPALQSRVDRLLFRSQKAGETQQNELQDEATDDNSQGGGVGISTNDDVHSGSASEMKVSEDKMATPIKSNISSASKGSGHKNRSLFRKPSRPGHIRGLNQKKSGR